ncbi:hypothetical protein CH367_19525 [Leptospira barantonii]|uniref:Uncharacterized protein n=1 Tax=Leptospira barantonii TaxID=2023184 RepID=A0ABX4NFT7_9LEPT|nr:hypothetical protein CH367_19525 [Leptospira barantonii]
MLSPTIRREGRSAIRCRKISVFESEDLVSQAKRTNYVTNKNRFLCFCFICVKSFDVTKDNALIYEIEKTSSPHKKKIIPKNLIF